MRILFMLVIFLSSCYPVHGEEMERINPPRYVDKIPRVMTGKALEARDVPVRVKSVEFEEVEYNGAIHLAAGVIFTKTIDSSTVQPNVNIRLLKEQNGFWVDVSTQNNVVRIMPKHVTWLAGVSLESGVYRMHLRGTIQDVDGLYLDCNNDGVGERGNLPAYDSPVYTVVLRDLEEMESGLLRILQQ